MKTFDVRPLPSRNGCALFKSANTAAACVTKPERSSPCQSTLATRSRTSLNLIALVHAAAGGVGQLLVQMITARGGRVIATAGTEEKRQIASDLGAETVIDYTADVDLAEAVREATGGRGVDVAYDGVGRSTFDASLGSLRPRGLLVLFGGASGQVPEFDLQRLNAQGSVFVTRPKLLDHVQDRDELLWRADEVLGAVADGSLKVDIGGRYALSDAAQAYADLEGRRTTGKVLLVP